MTESNRLDPLDPTVVAELVVTVANHTAELLADDYEGAERLWQAIEQPKPKTGKRKS